MNDEMGKFEVGEGTDLRVNFHTVNFLFMVGDRVRVVNMGDLEGVVVQMLFDGSTAYQVICSDKSLLTLPEGAFEEAE